MRQLALLCATAVAVGAFCAPAAAAPRVLFGPDASLRNAAAPAGSLQQVEVESSFGARFVRYRQTIAGIPVLDSDTVLTDSPGKGGDLLLDGSRTLGRAYVPKLSLSRSAAVRIASRYLHVTSLRAPAQASPGVLFRRGGPRTVWSVSLPARVPLASYQVVVDARSGTVLRVRDLLRNAFNETAPATVFDTNPLVAHGSRVGLSDSGDADSAALSAARDDVVLQRLDDAPLAGLPSKLCLQGRWVRATLPTTDAPPLGDVCETDGDFSATRSEQIFEAAMAYFHVDRAQQYLQSLGFANVRTSQQRVNVNDFPDDNSYFDPSTDEIALGEGGTDDGEDGEVIVHEYGHSIQDDQVSNFGATDEGGAMGEGFGDYLAAALAQAFQPNPTFDPCIAEWDQLGFGSFASVPCLRRVDTNLTASQVGPGSACDAEVHCAGEAWSGALWDIRAAIGGTVADRLVVQSHFSLTHQAGFHEGALALVAADHALYGGAHAGVVYDLLAARGLIDVDRFDDTPAGARPLSLPGQVTDRLDAVEDEDDVFALSLEAGKAIVIRLASGAEELDLRLLRPGTASVDDASAFLATGETAGSYETINFTPAATGVYPLDVKALRGAGDYVLSALPDGDADHVADGEDNCPRIANTDQVNRDADALGDPCDRYPNDSANDIDGDRIPGGRDNCPDKANRNQRDWDGDERGDLCDRSARVRLQLVGSSGGQLSLIASLRPFHLGPRAVRLQLQRLDCTSRCRYRKVTLPGRARRLKGGRVGFRVKAPSGDYRASARLVDRRYARVRSRTVRVVLD